MSSGQRQQLLAMAHDRLPVLRAEIEFWTLVLARLDAAPVGPPAHRVSRKVPAR